MAATTIAPPMDRTTPLLLPAMDDTISPAMPHTNTTMHAWVISRVSIGWRPLPGQRLVLDPVRLIGARPKLFVPPCFVLAEVPFEPADLAVALEGEHVCGDAIEEPAIVTDHDSAPRKVLERGL